ncbi:hypothetical protein [Leptospira barantonii]|nr:hypothetical protein [Leptospira barantonii]
MRNLILILWVSLFIGVLFFVQIHFATPKGVAIMICIFAFAK